MFDFILLKKFCSIKNRHTENFNLTRFAYLIEIIVKIKTEERLKKKLQYTRTQGTFLINLEKSRVL